MFKRLFFVLLVLVLSSQTWVLKAEEVLNFYNWSDYIGEDTIENFEKETGIKVNYDVYDSNEVLEAKVMTGNSGYDLVVPSDSFLAAQIKAGVHRKIDKTKIPNLKNIDPSFSKLARTFDKNNDHSVIYLWGTTGIAYNKSKIKEALGLEEIDSVSYILDPKKIEKLSKCGVSILDAPTEVYPMVLNYLGFDPASESLDHLKKAEEVLRKIVPYVTYFHSSKYINDLANGEICVSHGFSGDLYIAMDAAAEAENGVEINYFVPREGGVIWFDLFAIPKEAKNVENAYKFINYFLRPKVIAEATNYVYYPNAVPSSNKYILEEVITDEGIYPTEEIKSRLFSVSIASSKYNKARTRSWTKIKSGG